jgi:hypothetical protein
VPTAEKRENTKDCKSTQKNRAPFVFENESFSRARSMAPQSGSAAGGSANRNPSLAETKIVVTPVYLKLNTCDS